MLSKLAADEETETEDTEAKRRRLHQLSRNARIKKSMMNVMRQIEQGSAGAGRKRLLRMGALSHMLHTLEGSASNLTIIPGGDTKKESQKIINQVIDAHPHEIDKDHLYDPYEFFDDVTGKPMDKNLATAARELEMKYFKKMKVYEKVTRGCAAKDGCRVISTKW